MNLCFDNAIGKSMGARTIAVQTLIPVRENHRIHQAQL
jgi:hypothetical protein